VPKVSEEHLQRRRRQILQAAARCFARNGFHETSLQEIFRESGLSAGAVYRHFKSKDELVQAIGAEVFGRLSATLAAVLSRDPLPGVDKVVGSLALTVQDIGDEAGLAPLAWAEALHDPALARAVRENLTSLRAQMTGWLTRLRDDRRLYPDADVTALGAVLLALLPGYLVLHLLAGDPDDVTALEAGLAQLIRPELLTPPAATAPRSKADSGDRECRDERCGGRDSDAERG
jgi:TetR/AcrR family transcriptional regulator, transcriptional repressor of aconitase